MSAERFVEACAAAQAAIEDADLTPEERWQAMAVLLVIFAARADANLTDVLENVVACACAPEPEPRPGLHLVRGGKA